MQLQIQRTFTSKTQELKILILQQTQLLGINIMQLVESVIMITKVRRTYILRVLSFSQVQPSFLIKVEVGKNITKNQTLFCQVYGKEHHNALHWYHRFDASYNHNGNFQVNIDNKNNDNLLSGSSSYPHNRHIPSQNFIPTRYASYPNTC